MRPDINPGRGGRRSLAALATAITLVIGTFAIAPSAGAAPRVVTASSPATPSTADVRSPHPRLMADTARITQLKNQQKSDPTSQALADRVMAEASRLRGVSRINYSLSGGKMLSQATELVDRTYTLVVAWTLSGDKSYLDLLWKDLGPAAKLKSWNPDHMLDTAELTHAAAIAYDWANSGWTKDQRGQLRNAIVTLGLEPSLKIYDLAEGARSPYTYLGNWRLSTTNVNTIINSAMILGALAVAKDSTSSTVQKALTGASKSIRSGLSEYESDGGFSEGPTYWAYATRSAAAALVSLKTSTGRDYGLASVGGLSKTGSFALDLRSADDTVYNFADSSSLPGVVNLPLAGLARLYDSPSLGAASAVDVSGGYTRAAQQLIMRDPAWKNATAATGSLNASYATGVTTARSSTTSTDATYVAFRSASKYGTVHQHIDPGDFQLAALGQEWAVELGTEKATYDLADRSNTSARWTYYRTSSIGHNTLTIHPSRSGAVQPSATKAGVSSAAPDEFFATTDASAAVTGSVSSWKRGVRLFDGRSQALVQDEVTSSKATEAIWGMHTRALIDISSDGRQAVLAQNGERLLARIVTSGAKFTDMPASALPTSPQPSQEKNGGVRRLSVWFPVAAGKTTTLAVQFTPLAQGADAAKAPSAVKVSALSSWKALGTASTLNGITVAGKAVPGFSSKTATYDVAVTDPNTLPQVAATGSGSISVVQATRSTMTARVTVKNGSDRATTYLVRFLVAGDPAVVEGRVSRDPRSRTVDGQPDTAWDPASVSGRSLTWRLDKAAPLRSVMLTMSTSTYTSTQIRLEVSADRKTWSAARTGTFTGPTATQSFAVAPTSNARYVRVTVPSGDAQIAEAVFLRYDASSENVPRPASIPGAATLSGFDAKPTLGKSGQARVTSKWSTSSKTSTTTKWVTSNSEVLSVNSSGAWKALARGSAQVGAIVTTPDGITVTATIAVTVNDPTRIKIPVARDAFVAGSTPSTTFGGLKYLLNKPTNSASVERISYLGFDLSPLMGREVRSAVLTVPAFIRSSEKGSTARVDLHTATGTWSESTLTYANRPKSGSTVASVLATKTAQNQSADLTKNLAALVSSKTKTASYALTQDNVGAAGSLVEMASRESGKGAYIEVVLAPASADAVPPSRLGSVTVSGAPSALGVGKSATTTANPKDSTGARFTRARVTYSSSDTSIFTVSSKGVVKGTKPGRASLNVSATADGITVTWWTRIQITK